ncbi:hypothetical protein V6N11_071510 [Hibiscus sabdariffa]|uniref:Uncharacterized protein n=1 Tax=Hibiscus sabdariffa TaxID=183260 RepID=A0ABR2U106_9ROSI
MLLLCQRLRKGINNVIVCMYFAYFHISSIYNLWNEMEAPKNMFRSLMRSGFLCLHNGSIVITMEFYSIRLLEMTKGMSQLETTGPAWADYLGWDQISTERLAELLAYV